MHTLWQDVRYGLRMLGKNPGFTAIAVLTLALGIGANTAIFSVVYAALLRPLPFSHPDRLVTLTEVRGQSQDPFWDASYPDYLDWIKQSKTFVSLAGFSGDGFTFTGANEPQLIFAAQSTPNFFSTLGVKPYLGRDFLADEQVPENPKVALLAYGFWRSEFGGDTHVVGRSIRLDGNAVTIIGVLPPEFEFAPASSAKIWVPLHPGTDMASRRNLRWLSVVGRLAPGTTIEQARTEMSAVAANLAAAYPQEDSAVSVVLGSLRERIVGQVRPLLIILFGAVGFVLLIACANVANLLLVRASGRKKEFAIRMAMGASRAKLVFQLLTESLLLATAGGALGYVGAQWGMRVLIAAIPSTQLDAMPYLRDAHASGAVFAFLAGVAILTGILFGLAPSFQASNEHAGEVLKQETRTASGVKTRLRDVLVVAEVAISLVLLVGAGLMVKSLGELLQKSPGFDMDNLLSFAVNLPAASYPKDADSIRFDKEFRTRLQNLPGVVAVANTSVVPLTGGGNTIRFLIEGHPVATGKEDECDIRDVSANYFSTMKIPLIAGRFFDVSADAPEALKHVIVNQAWVKAYLQGEDPVGKRIKFTFSPTQPYREIVGVVGDIADAGLDSGPVPAIFSPFEQDTSPFLNYLVRVKGNPATAISTMRSELHHADPQLAFILPRTMDDIIAQSPSVFLRRYPSYLIGSFAGLAIILAMVGLYGLISFSVSQRTREVGIRMALGADRSDVLRLVMRQGAALVFSGILLGVIAGLALTRLMASLLFEVKPSDPATFVTMAVTLAGISLIACWLPARKATRVDPMVALRYE